MKEASGELSMTAIAVVAIAAIGILFTTFIYPNIRDSLLHSQLCSASYGCNCTSGSDTCTCKAMHDGAETQVTCDNPDINED